MVMISWAVDVIVETGQPIPSDVLIELGDRGDEVDVTVSRGGGPTRASAMLEFEAQTPLEAHRRAVEQVKALFDEHLTGEIVDVRVCRPEIAEAEAFKPDTPPLLSSPDVAEMLGVSRQRVHQLDRGHPQFPPPYARLGAGPIWTLPQIEHFAKIWDRRPGRRARTG